MGQNVLGCAWDRMAHMAQGAEPSSSRASCCRYRPKTQTRAPSVSLGKLCGRTNLLFVKRRGEKNLPH